MYAIGPRSKSHQQFCWPVQLTALQEALSDEEIEVICSGLGHKWRNRTFPPGTTVRSVIYRSLHPDKSIWAVLTDLAATDDRLLLAPTESAWCQARSRLPEGLWPELMERTTRRVLELVANKYQYMVRTVYLVDGSTVSMPDEPELVDAFGYANTKHGPSRFPVARTTFITHAGAEVVYDYRIGPYRTSEDAQFHDMWHRLPRCCICILDRRFCSFYNLAKLRQRRIDVVTQLHQRRDPDKLIAQGRQVGKDEWLVPLELSPQLRQRYNDASLPQRLWVRLIRVGFRHKGKRRVIWLVTTLLDTERYSRSSISRLYRRRWGIETRIGSLKTTLEMDVLRSKTTKGVLYEVAGRVLGHNLIWTVIHQAAVETDTPAARISFAGAIKTVLAFSAALRTAKGIKRIILYRRMLCNIACHRNPYRPGRTEPRLVKRDKRRYAFLKVPRKIAREMALS